MSLRAALPIMFRSASLCSKQLRNTSRLRPLLLQCGCKRGLADKVQDPRPPRMSSRFQDKAYMPVSWKGVAVVFVVGTGAYFVLRYMRKVKDLEIEKERNKSLGRAALGGPWELVDHTGKPRKSSDFHGQWTLLYFGFTHCPDICPDELEKMVKAVDAVDRNKDVPNVIPLFITVDPHRDTVEAVADYVKEFSDKMIGLTGSDEQVAQAAKAYRVYFSAGPKDEDDDYIVDHSIVMYLVNPEGEFVDYYGQNKTAEEVESGIVVHMLKYAAMKK